MRTGTVLVLLGTLLFAGCYYDNKEELYPNACGALDITWNTGIRPIVQTRCATGSTCHIGGDRGDFNVVDVVRSRAGQIRSYVVAPGGVMPPAGEPQLTPCQIEQMKQWLDSGAPNN